MPPNAKAWIFASNKILNNQEKELITNKLSSFVQSWTAHQKELKATFDILHSCFVVVMLDEAFNEVSGCGIDKLVAKIKEIEQETGLDFFNRTNVQIIENKEVKIYSKAEALQKLTNKEITENHKTFNNQICNKSEFENDWEISVSKAWFYPKIKLQSL